MDFLQLAKERFSVLEYDARPVEEEKIGRIISAGLAAPIACNHQPQRILRIDTDDAREKLNRVVPSQYDVSPRVPGLLRQRRVLDTPV